MPVLFIGHGSPMNAIEENPFSRNWKELGENLPKPSAILCISAHWETNGTFITASVNQRTIHDFYGFPDELFAVQYPAPGNPKLAGEIQNMSPNPKIEPDLSWGLDHGCWSILKRMYPQADVPVVQLSLDYTISPEKHYLIAKQLKVLRQRGVLIIGSGNMVHNLRMIDWKNSENGHDWALEANEQFKKLILAGDYLKLMQYDLLGKAVRLAVPTPEHFLPLLYVLAQSEEHEEVSIFNDQCVYGSISMTSIKINS